MPESTSVWALLSVAAFLAGAVNSIAGGGTLLTFSSLLTVLSPVPANASSTFALFPGSLAAALGYRREVSLRRDYLMWLWPPSFLCGLVGSLLVTRLPERVFAGMVPWLLMGASTLLLLQRPVARWAGAHPHKKPSKRVLAAIIGFQFLVGVYGGYFGAGIGILMLTSLAFSGIPGIHEMNAIKSVLAATMNVISIVIFGLAGVIVWKYAIVMAGACAAGGYLGARVARRMSASVVRFIVVIIGFLVGVYSLFK